MSEFILDTETFWHSRPWLQYVHDDAKFRRLNPFALLLAVMARLSALTPPNVTVQVSPHDRPMSLNLNVVLVGAAGTGKGKTLREARELLPTPEGNRMLVKKPRTGEGIVTAFVDRTELRDEEGKIHKGHYKNKILTDRVLLELSEVTDLRTAMAGEGSTMLGTLLSGFSGETLGGNTRTARSNVTLPPNTYRLSSVIAAQPSQCDVFFSNAEVGFASRFLFAPQGIRSPPMCSRLRHRVASRHSLLGSRRAPTTRNLKRCGAVMGYRTPGVLACWRGPLMSCTFPPLPRGRQTACNCWAPVVNSGILTRTGSNPPHASPRCSRWPTGARLQARKTGNWLMPACV